MSYLATEAITDLRSEFEGGKALSLDFYGLLKRGARNTLDYINPETLKRRVPIYGGIANNLAVYYCPEDVKVPSAVYRQPHDRVPVATYTSPINFFTTNKPDLFTIEYINGVRFLLVRQSVPYRFITIDEMDAVGTKVSDMALTVNDFNFVSGNGALQRTFAEVSATPAVNRVSDTFTTPIDITEMLNGILLVPMVFENAKNISVVKVELKTSASHFYSLTSATDSVGDNFIDGLNLVRLKLSERATTGMPVDTNITEWTIKIETVAGTTETVIIDKISLQKSAQYYFEYYSNRLFIDGTTGAWKEAAASGDRINLAQEARDILHYETVLLIAQGNTKIRQSRSGFDNFTGQLARKYNQYWERFPSSEQPLSYNNMHDNDMPFLPSYIGGKLSAETGVTDSNFDVGTQFVDNETPNGVINGVNAVFTLVRAPNPANSLMLWLNGVYQVQGVDYTLSGGTITFTTPPSIAFVGLPFVGFYRYT